MSGAIKPLVVTRGYGEPLNTEDTHPVATNGYGEWLSEEDIKRAAQPVYNYYLKQMNFLGIASS